MRLTFLGHAAVRREIGDAGGLAPGETMDL